MTKGGFKPPFNSYENPHSTIFLQAICKIFICRSLDRAGAESIKH